MDDQKKKMIEEHNWNLTRRAKSVRYFPGAFQSFTALPRAAGWNVSGMQLKFSVFFFPVVFGRVVVTTNSSEAPTQESYTSAAFEYYGPKDAIVSGRVVFLRGSNLCNPDASMVSAAIVVSDRHRAACELEELYGALSDAGALAFVVLVRWNPPGLLAFRHSTWNRCKYCGHPMTMVSVYERSGPGDSVYEKWLEEGANRMVIEPAHDETMRELYLGPLWIICMRIVPSLFALWVFFLAASEVIRLRGNRSIGYIICSAEAPACLLVSIAMAADEYGSVEFPYQYHLTMVTLLSSVSMLTTLFFALFMFEEQRHLASGDPRRDIFVYWKWTLISISVFIFGCELVFQLSVLNNYVMSAISVILGLSIYGIVQCGTGIFFVKKAYQYRVHLAAYLGGKSYFGTPIASPPAVKKSFYRIGRLAVWMGISGTCMLFSAVSIVSFIFSTAPPLGMSDSSGTAWFVSTFVFTMARIGASFAQIKAIKPHEESVGEAVTTVCRFMISCVCYPSASKVNVEPPIDSWEAPDEAENNADAASAPNHLDHPVPQFQRFPQPNNLAKISEVGGTSFTSDSAMISELAEFDPGPDLRFG